MRMNGGCETTLGVGYAFDSGDDRCDDSVDAIGPRLSHSISERWRMGRNPFSIDVVPDRQDHVWPTGLTLRETIKLYTGPMFAKERRGEHDDAEARVSETLIDPASQPISHPELKLVE